MTFDKDFGELAFRSPLPAKCGVILFRIPEQSSSHIARVVVSAIESRADWTGHFSVIEEHRIRMRPLKEVTGKFERGVVLYKPTIDGLCFYAESLRPWHRRKAVEERHWLEEHFSALPE